MPRIAIDWDGTCVEHAYPAMGDWLPGAVEALQHLDDEGWNIVIFSCRVAPLKPDERTPSDFEAEVNQIKQMLSDVGLRHVEVWLRNYKPPASFYVDDRAVHFGGDWDAVVVEIDRRLGH